jgi:HPt (histidine-containing phosphotransfer) domain-containing protein
MLKTYQHIRPQALLDNIEGDVELFLQLSQTFMRNTPPTVTQLTTACRNGDLPAAVRLAHSLKNTADIIGAASLSALARNLETMARETAGQPMQPESLLSAISEELVFVYAEVRAAMLSISG